MSYLQLFRLFLEIMGSISLLFSISLFIWAIISWFLGVFPLFLRLGFGRWYRKISIIAEEHIYSSLYSDLKSTNIFRLCNIDRIDVLSLSKVKNAGLVLVHYSSLTEEQIKTIISYKDPKAGFIFYFPEFDPSSGKMIPTNMLQAIGREAFTTIVNARGRLINDIVTTLLSTPYEKK